MPELYQASSPQQYHQYQQQVAQAPDPRQNGSKRNSACHVSACTVCGRPSNFLCSACQKVNYCTSRCQVKRLCYIQTNNYFSAKLCNMKLR